MRQIVDVQLENIKRQIINNKDIEIIIDDSVKDMLANEGYDQAFGARPLKRLIQRKILDPLSIEIIESRVSEGDKVNSKLVNDKVVFEKV